jgi:hypothetical protein
MIDFLAKQPLSFQPCKGWRYGPERQYPWIYYLETHRSTPRGIPLVVYIRTLGHDRFWLRASYVKGRAPREQPQSIMTMANSSPPPSQACTIPRDLNFSAVKAVFILSTFKDYRHFSQMILNGGEFEGKRYLEASTVEMMCTNVLESDEVLPVAILTVSVSAYAMLSCKTLPR